MKITIQADTNDVLAETKGQKQFLHVPRGSIGSFYAEGRDEFVVIKEVTPMDASKVTTPLPVEAAQEEEEPLPPETMVMVALMESLQAARLGHAVFAVTGALNEEGRVYMNHKLQVRSPNESWSGSWPSGTVRWARLTPVGRSESGLLICKMDVGDRAPLNVIELPTTS